VPIFLAIHYLWAIGFAMGSVCNFAIQNTEPLFFSIMNHSETLRAKALRLCTQIITEERQLPELGAIAKKLGCTLQELEKALVPTGGIGRFALLSCFTENIIATVFAKAMEGSVSHQKLWLQLIENWAPAKTLNPDVNKAMAEHIHINIKPFTDAEGSKSGV